MKVTVTLGKIIVTGTAVVIAAVLLFSLLPRASAMEDNKSITVLTGNGEEYLIHRDQESKLDGSITISDRETGDTAIVMIDGSVILTTGSGEILTGKIVTD